MDECDDGNLVAHDGCSPQCRREGCYECSGSPSMCVAMIPVSGCQRPSVSRKSKLVITDQPVISGLLDKLVWRWAKGTRTAEAGFGNPLATTEYNLCIYDRVAGNDVLVAGHRVAASVGWKSARRGFNFRDRSLAQDGILSIRLKQGRDRRARVVVRGRGPNLNVPRLPLAQDGPVTVQLHNGVTCWEDRYSTALRNTAFRFKAKGD